MKRVQISVYVIISATWWPSFYGGSVRVLGAAVIPLTVQWLVAARQSDLRLTAL